MVAFPKHVQPMLATLAKALPGDDDSWAYEFKWDGIRAIALWDGTRLRFETRNLRDVTHAWPELAHLGEALGHRAVVLDGEIVAMDERGVPSFQRLQERMHVADPANAARLAQRIPASYLVFDVLHLDGENLMPLPWTERRQRLDGLGLKGPCWATTPAFVGAGTATWEAAKQRDMEGVMAKRVDAPYVAGARSKSWLKIKLQHSDEFVVGGWQPGEGRRTDRIGSLLLGTPSGDGGLAYVGNVGTGFSDKELTRLQDRLRGCTRPTSPFTAGPATKKGAVFVEPELVVEVEFTERTKDGILRHPSYKGVRIDKSADDVNT